MVDPTRTRSARGGSGRGLGALVPASVLLVHALVALVQLGQPALGLLRRLVRTEAGFAEAALGGSLLGDALVDVEVPAVVQFLGHADLLPEAQALYRSSWAWRGEHTDSNEHAQVQAALTQPNLHRLARHVDLDDGAGAVGGLDLGPTRGTLRLDVQRVLVLQAAHQPPAGARRCAAG